MNNCRNYSTFTLTLGNVFTLLILIGLFASRRKDESTRNSLTLAGGYSILVNNGNVLVIGFKSDKGNLSCAMTFFQI